MKNKIVYEDNYVKIDWFRWLLLLIILGLISLAIYLNYIGVYPLK